MSFEDQTSILLHSSGQEQFDHSRLGISRFPTTPGQHIQLLKQDNLWSLPASAQYEVLLTSKRFEQSTLRKALAIQRSGFAYNGFDRIQLTPMHGLSKEWRPICAGNCERLKHFQGFLWTRDCAHEEKSELDRLRAAFCGHSGLTEDDLTFLGDESDDNLFARLVRGEIPQWRIWQDDEHIAFLTPFGNTPGAMVIIPRRHLSSDILGLAEDDFEKLMVATRTVANLIMRAMECDRVGMFFEGFEIDYAHVKLAPVLNKAEGSAAVEGQSDEFHDTYPGYLSTRLGPGASKEALEDTFNRIRKYSKDN